MKLRTDIADFFLEKINEKKTGKMGVAMSKNKEKGKERLKALKLATSYLPDNTKWIKRLWHWYHKVEEISLVKYTLLQNQSLSYNSLQNR